MNLAIITPTRRRWSAVLEQAQRLSAQIGADDRWIIVIDNDSPPDAKIHEKLKELIGPERLAFCLLHYMREEVPVARVNYAHNVGVQMAPPGYGIVELDDHDPLEPNALSELRHALEAGYDYVFGNYKQRALFPTPTGRVISETWPNVTRTYQSGGIERGELGTDGIALRAFTRELWDKLGGWDVRVWPCADKDFAIRAERSGANIVCLDAFLCTVTIEGDSLSANYRGVNPLAEAAS